MSKTDITADIGKHKFELAGLKSAERLHAAGWRIIRTGLFLITFERIKQTTV